MITLLFFCVPNLVTQSQPNTNYMKGTARLLIQEVNNNRIIDQLHQRAAIAEAKTKAEKAKKREAKKKEPRSTRITLSACKGRASSRTATDKKAVKGYNGCPTDHYFKCLGDGSGICQGNPPRGTDAKKAQIQRMKATKASNKIKKAAATKIGAAVKGMAARKKVAAKKSMPPPPPLSPRTAPSSPSSTRKRLAEVPTRMNLRSGTVGSRKSARLAK